MMPMRGLQNRVIPELWAEYVLQCIEHIPHCLAHSMIIMLEDDHKHMEVAELILQPVDHRLDMIVVIPKKNLK